MIAGVGAAVGALAFLIAAGVPGARPEHRPGQIRAGARAEVGDMATAPGIAVGPASRGPTPPLKSRLDLPADIALRLGDDASVGDVVDALIRAAGVPFTSVHGAVVVDDAAIVPIDAIEVTGRIRDDQLDEGFRVFSATGARCGIALTDGQLPAREIERRHLLGSRLRHGGIEALQRLADEVALDRDVAGAVRDLAARHAAPSR